ncbi:hypothetical protein [Intestinimonas timonensis]|uniref:hypothetical protein n=1 Tax=Intestinimonas timonensis TaxID=1689270 RepID=UPI0023F32AC6|nr:hypothetical protein [Intestinimonas timonensis]
MSDGFSEKLNAILADPDAMGKIMSLAQSLDGEAAPNDQDTPEEPPALSGGQADTPPDLSGLLSAFTGGGGEALDPKLLQLAGRLLSEWNRPDDHKTALLAALRPYVKPERYAKVDRAIQIAKFSRLIRVALAALREGREDV